MVVRVDESGEDDALASVDNLGPGIQGDQCPGGGIDVHDPSVPYEKTVPAAPVPGIAGEENAVGDDQETLFQVVPVFLSSSPIPIRASPSRILSESAQSF